MGQTISIFISLGISIIAYGVFSRGLLSTTAKSPDLSKGDLRGMFPRFQPENLSRNQKLIDGLRSIAVRKNCSLPQLALAWVLSRGEDIVPLVGARTPERLNEALGGVAATLSADDLAQIDRVADAGQLPVSVIR